MATMQLPTPGGQRAAALASVVMLLALALLAVAELWALLLASVVGLGLLRYTLAGVRQRAVQAAASSLVVSVDVESGRTPRRRRGKLDTIEDDSLEEGQSPTGQPASSKKERFSNDIEKQLGIPNFEKAAVSGKARKRPPEGCHRILGDLDSPPSSVLPSARSERSVTSQRIIEELQAQLQTLREQSLESRSNPPSNPPSARSDRSVRSDTSQRIIDDLKAQIQKLKDDKTCHTPMSARSDKSGKSVRSDTSQRIINDLEAQIKELRDEVRNSRRMNGSPRNAGDLKSLLRSLQLPEEYDKILENDGIEFLEDVVEYSEAELVELGFKRAHAKRLLKAATANDAPAAEGKPVEAAGVRPLVARPPG